MSKTSSASNKLGEFGKEISNRRKSKGLSREELAFRIGCSLKSIQRWEAGKVALNVGNVNGLKRELHFTDAEMAYYLSEQYSEHLRSKSFGDFIVAKRLMDLSSQTKELEDGWPRPDIEGNDYGTEDKWLSIYNSSPDTGLVVLDHLDKALGFWHFVFVSKTLYQKCLEGHNINRDITSADLMEPIPGTYDVYFVDLFTRQGVKNPAIGRALLIGFVQKLVEYAHCNVFVRRMCANLSTEDVFPLSKQLGFNFVRLHREHKMSLADGSIVPTQIEELLLMDNEDCPLFNYDSQLKKMYAKKKV